jgi:lipoprotein Spr
MKFKQLILSLMLLTPLYGHASLDAGRVTVNDIHTVARVPVSHNGDFFRGGVISDTVPSVSAFTGSQAQKMLPAKKTLLHKNVTAEFRKVPAKKAKARSARKVTRITARQKAAAVSRSVLAKSPVTHSRTGTGKISLPDVKQAISQYNQYKMHTGVSVFPEKNRMVSDVKSRYQKTLNRYKRNIIMSKFRSWEGVRYKWGGTTRKGIDCSALVQHFARGLNVELPRTTGQQIKTGEKIRKHELRAGDLVFFWTSPVQRHVGIYIGKSEFIHASSSKGVTKSSLNNAYWKSHYETGIRVTA